MRRFLRHSIIACTLILLSAPAFGQTTATAPTTQADAQQATLEGTHVKVTYDLSAGRWSATLDGKPFAQDMEASAEIGTRLSSTGEHTRKAEIVKDPDDGLGAGPMMVVTHSLEGVELLQRIRIATDGRFVYAGLAVRNTGTREVRVKTMVPLAGTVATGGKPEDLRFLTYGKSWSAALRRGATQSSTFHLPFHDIDSKSGGVIGAADARRDSAVFLTASAQTAKVTGQCDHGTPGGGELCRSGATVETSAFFLTWDANSVQAMEDYARLVNRHNRISLPASPTGWCSWYCYWDYALTEDVVLANIDFISKGLRDYGLLYFQLDDGWQKGTRCSGDWEANAKFPRGMKYIADQARAAGLKPGLWLGPFGEDGDNRGQPALYTGGKGYDLAGQGWQSWMAGLMDKVWNQWGYEYQKHDFLAYGKSTDRDLPFQEVYRRGLKLAKAKAPKSAFFLSCIPANEFAALGCSDAQRIGGDVDAAWRYMMIAAEVSGRKFHINRQFYIADPDVICVRPPLSTEMARMYLTLGSLFGGSLLMSEKYPELPPDRVEMTKKVLPATGDVARCVDVFEPRGGFAPDYPRIWDARVARPFESWHVVGLFNWDLTRGHDLAIDFAKDLDLPPGSDQLVYDFWADRFLGVFRDGLTAGLLPARCQVLGIRARTGRPQVLATTRHITMGGADLAEVQWQDPANTLSGVFTAGVAGQTHEIVLYVPASYRVKPASQDTLRIDGQTVRLALTPAKTGPVRWSLAFETTGSADTPALAARQIASFEGVTLPANIRPVYNKAPMDVQYALIEKVQELTGPSAELLTRPDFLTLPGPLQTVILRNLNNPRAGQAMDLLAKEGAIPWKVVGPFRSGERYGFDTAFAPEKTPDAASYDSTIDGQASKVQWQSVTSARYAVDLDKLWKLNDQASAYARTRVFSPKAQKAMIGLGSDDGVRMWVNGKQLWSHYLLRGVALDEDMVAVELQEGWNTILLKITDWKNAWGFALRVCDADGLPLEGIKYSAD